MQCVSAWLEKPLAEDYLSNDGQKERSRRFFNKLPVDKYFNTNSVDHHHIYAFKIFVTINNKFMKFVNLYCSYCILLNTLWSSFFSSMNWHEVMWHFCDNLLLPSVKYPLALPFFETWRHGVSGLLGNW